jgi:hypothetical protein
MMIQCADQSTDIRESPARRTAPGFFLFQVRHFEMDSDNVGFSRFVAAVGIIDKYDPAVGKHEPGRIAMVGPGLLVCIVLVYLDHPLLLVPIRP